MTTVKRQNADRKMTLLMAITTTVNNNDHHTLARPTTRTRTGTVSSWSTRIHHINIITHLPSDNLHEKKEKESSNISFFLHQCS
jgi:hypothetical protein